MLIACGGEEPEASEMDCGDGDQFDVDGEIACVYSQAITEEGFSCPAEMSGPVSYGDLQICWEGGGEELPDELFGDLHESFEGLPTGPCMSVTCAVGEACAGGSCEARECWSDSDCSQGSGCNSGFCEDSSPDISCSIVAQGRVQGTSDWHEGELDASSLNEIELRPSTTEDTEGLSPQWLLTERPASSQAELLPDGDVEEPTITPDVVGVYTVELSFVDEEGEVACGPSELTLHALAGGDILVQLSWEVPASESGMGTDLDVHYLHPSGSWGEGDPWEVSSWNNSADWGDDGEASLDLDDLVGEFPESIFHSDPGAGPYSVGVKYVSDSMEYGPTIATIRIFVGDTLVFTEDRELENEGDFWWVADIVAEPVGFSVRTDEDEHGIYDGFPD